MESRTEYNKDRAVFEVDKERLSVVTHESQLANQGLVQRLQQHGLAALPQVPLALAAPQDEDSTREELRKEMELEKQEMQRKWEELVAQEQKLQQDSIEIQKQKTTNSELLTNLESKLEEQKRRNIELEQQLRQTKSANISPDELRTAERLKKLEQSLEQDKQKLREDEEVLEEEFRRLQRNKEAFEREQALKSVPSDELKQTQKLLNEKQQNELIETLEQLNVDNVLSKIETEIRINPHSSVLNEIMKDLQRIKEKITTGKRTFAGHQRSDQFIFDYSYTKNRLNPLPFNNRNSVADIELPELDEKPY